MLYPFIYWVYRFTDNSLNKECLDTESNNSIYFRQSGILIRILNPTALIK